jgi:F-type H+-transporting ATPase subunit c
VLNRQPTGTDQNFKVIIIGMALIESGIILALVMSLLLIFNSSQIITWGSAFAELGIGTSMGIASAAISISSSFVVKSSAESISRQPFFSQKIITIMLLSQSIIEASIIFTFIIALIIKNNIFQGISVQEGLKLLAAGITMSLGSIGPSIGQAIFSHSSCRSVGINKNSYDKIFPFSLLSQAITETPIIFCLLISILIIYSPVSANSDFVQIISMLIASFTMGFGTIGSSFGMGFIASKAVCQMAYEPLNYSIIARTALVAEAFVESIVIYAMIISLFLIML